jgi:Cu(I)/Ag(I) efflux system membrane protein CusA/SilA
VNVRYPQDLRSDIERLKQVLVPAASSEAPSGDMGAEQPLASGGRRAYVPLGELAHVRVAGGPPMVRDEDGMLVGYVYVDVDGEKRDVGGYVDDAKRTVQRAIDAGRLTLPAGYSLRWTGQYELMQETSARMKVVLPLTLAVVVLLLFLHFKSWMEVLIVLLSIPFALVGSVWLLWLLDYRLSTAVWVGVIALIGLAAQTGIVMIVYIDHAFERRKRAGKIRDLNDIIWAHLEGTVLRVRPKLMTVSTMLIGLTPLLWASGSGADVMKRIAAPMVGGLLTSAFLTLELIPVVYTYWRHEQLLWELLSAHDARRLRRLQQLAYAHAAGWALLALALVARIYVSVPAAWNASLLLVSAGAIALSAAAYLSLRPAARRLVWP